MILDKLFPRIENKNYDSLILLFKREKGERMYRFSMDGQQWILRFSQHLEIEDEEKESIIRSVIIGGAKLKGFSHGDSFLLYDKVMGVIIFRIEKVPSCILTVSTIVPKEKWYIKNDSSIDPYRA